MTDAEMGALAAGGILGGAIVTVAIVGLIFYLLIVIANWKIFTKAGEAGWKSLIPIYNIYILYKISGVSFLTWFVLPILAGGFLAGIIGGIANNPEITSFITSIIDIVVLVKIDCALADAFGKGTGFKVGLIFLPMIFTLILGFGSAEYVGPANKE